MLKDMKVISMVVSMQGACTKICSWLIGWLSWQSDFNPGIRSSEAALSFHLAYIHDNTPFFTFHFLSSSLSISLFSPSHLVRHSSFSGYWHFSPSQLTMSERQAQELLQQADKRLNSWSWFGGGNKEEEAAELYEKAGNTFKLAQRCKPSLGASWDGISIHLCLP